MLWGLLAARWVGAAWIVLVLAFSHDALAHPLAAWSAAGFALGVTIAATLLLRGGGSTLLTPEWVIFDLTLASALSILDGWVFDAPHVFETSQNLASVMPFVAAAGAGVALGPAAAFAVLPLGIARLVGVLIAPDVSGIGELGGKEWTALLGSTIWLVAAAGVAGWMSRLLRRAEDEVALERARSEVASTLHDGVLQTLALVTRRVGESDPELAAHARETDRTLRAFLADGASAGPSGDRLDSGADWIGAFRAQLYRTGSLYDIDVMLSVVDEDSLNALPSPLTHELRGALSEAVANAAKHSGADRVVVFLDADDASVTASVRDDGSGFDPSDGVGLGRGLKTSVIDRIEAIGGTCDVRSSRGSGTEIIMTIDVARPRGRNDDT